jgi:hypothetical protein
MRLRYSKSFNFIFRGDYNLTIFIAVADFHLHSYVLSMPTHPRQTSVVQSPWENGHSTNPHNFTSFCGTDSFTTVRQRILSWASWINSEFFRLIYLYRFRVFFWTQLRDLRKSNIQLHLWHSYFITPVDDDLPAGCCRMYLGAFCVPSQYYVTFVHSFYLFFSFLMTSYYKCMLSFVSFELGHGTKTFPSLT